ncbi:hypothetical protein [Pedobacter caeni]|uniref:Uncharacterized protein n=1 Tax=Pedobacter caeni TaxID=288992 RepID=A0A1M4UEQ7_9SPHI|nr:hypothetical protein [Pedobacter caeni]SHE55098.1 hypothetical protein SAMN04488522_101528 [Pedobacter caeni]
MVKPIFILIVAFLLSLSPEKVFSQNYNKLVYNVKGDLNNDNLEDLVTVKADTADLHHPFLFEIKFQTKGGKYVTVLKSETAVMDKYPEGTSSSLCILESLKVNKGMIIFRNQMDRGSMTHKFRFQHNNFELIGYTYHYAAPGAMEFVDYNLSTGEKLEKKTEYETDQILEKKTSIVKMNPLPNLKNFHPLDFTY